SRTTANNPQQNDQQVGGGGGNRVGGLGGAVGGRGGRGGGGGGGGRGGRNAGGATDSPYNLTLGIQFSNLFNRNNRGIPVGSLNSPLFGESVSTGGSFGFFGGGGGLSSGNRRVELQARFSW
ncbi:MAG: hypothetical protein M3384_16865, partial [Acidobacteriota bacterium]|nr:hypothetical protein [Acidobacteriota bacterium]